MKFRNKILLAIWGIVLGLQLITFVFIRYWVRGQVQSTFSENLRTNYSTLAEINRLRTTQDIRSSQVIAESPRLKAVAELSDRETARQVLRELDREIGSNLMVLTDAAGHPLVEFLDGADRPVVKTTPRSITGALGLRPSFGVWVVGERAYRVTSVPVTVGPQLVGTLSIGNTIRESDLEQIKLSTGADVMLVSGNRALLGTLVGDADRLLGAWTGKGLAPGDTTEPDIVTVDFANESYVTAFYHLTPEWRSEAESAGYLIAKPVNREVEAALQPVLRAWAVLSIVVLLIAALLGYFISQGITRPINALVQGTTEVARGNYDHHIARAGSGELSFLARSFENMSQSLKEKITQLNDRNIALEQALKTLRETQGRFQAILDTSPSLIFVKDPDGKYLLVNRRFESVFDVKNEQVVGKTDAELFPSGIAAVLHEHDADVLRDLQPLGSEQVIQVGNHSYSYFTNKFALYDASGSAYAICAVLTDVTQRKTLEEQLRQAQKLESLGTMAGGIAHDFNNILGIILGHVSMLDKRMANPERLRQSMDSISRAVDRGTILVRQLLTFARKTDVLFEPLSVNSIVEELVGMLQATFPKNMTLATDLDPDLLPITADGNQLHQALLNLSVNARDAMGGGGRLFFATTLVPGEELVRKFPAAEKEMYVRISITDNGAGMDSETRKRIFEPFFTTKGVGKGTGLGLAVVYGVVEGHRGFVDFESAPGRGTSFHLYFPAERGAEQLAKTARGIRSDVRGGDETILVVEDEEMLADLLRGCLESKGYTVITAGDGMQALRLLSEQKTPIHLVFTDLGLPVLGGSELVTRIKAMRPDAKIIVASGYFEPEVKAEILDSGAELFVQKPYVPDDVLSKVRMSLDRD